MATANYVTATLATATGDSSYSFLINPEVISSDFTARYAQLAILNTPQPLAYYQSSSGGLNLPVVRFYTPNSDQPLDPYLAQIASFTKPGPDGDPPLLTLSFGQQVYERLKLVSFPYQQTRWKDGYCTEATGSMSFLFSPETPVPLEEPVTTELSEREQQEAADMVDQVLTAGGLKERNGIPADMKPVVDKDGNVTLNGSPLPSLADILGDQLPEAWRNLGKSPEEVAESTPQPAMGEE